MKKWELFEEEAVLLRYRCKSSVWILYV